MRDAKKLGGIAIIFIVLLRLSIGWQFLYEGLWKCDTMQSSRPWTAAGYLRNAQGPLRDHFRNMTGDPDELNWLDYNKMAAKWDRWHERFLAHHTDLTKDQKKRINTLLNGNKELKAILNKLPAGINIKGPSLQKVIRFDKKSHRLIVDGNLHLVPKEVRALERMAKKSGQLFKKPDEKERKEENDKALKEFTAAIKRLKALSGRFSFKEQLRISLKGDPERAAIVNADGRRIGKIDRYKEMLKNYEEDLKKSQQDFQQDHLKYQWNLIQKMRSELVGPIKAMEKDLYAKADNWLTIEQLQRGPVPAEPSQMRSLDNTTIWGLLILGGMLLMGFGTRIAALGGAVMLLSFYLVIPPFPGVPPAPGPEHSLFVNKNLIEMIALIAIVFLPTGQWFGLDRWVYGSISRLWSKPKPDSQPVITAPQKEKTPQAPAKEAVKPDAKPDGTTYQLDNKKK
ncbi:hypothetical protein MNBD_PLANCTO02-935 [hydrothermal vent metagenome]|uniref:TQO small subunit DoxD domain-containing protein n=1 Tax=hydrothermal vent metagenome TaxID=652676 RepID=A0A3B1DT51_9ZZZZ